MSLPSQLTIYDASYALDGGTTTLYATDERGAEHRVLLPRGIDSSLQQTIGRLYFDGELVPARSAFESKPIALIKNAVLARSSIATPGSFKLEPPLAVAGDDLQRLLAGTADEKLRRLVASVIKYVESDTYGPAYPD